MSYQKIFRRFEIKYLLDAGQKALVLEQIAPYMQLDKYGRTTIRNIYFDTDDYRIIRHSIEKPAYKEKLRLRSYKKASEETPVFVELKKKHDSVVYKRRLAMNQDKAMDWLCAGANPDADCQIFREIEYFRNFYETLHPVAFLSYEREAYFQKGGGDFRITFDENILCRMDRLSLSEDVGGTAILPQGMTLMELKTPGGIPLWLVELLSREKIYKVSFSKYGTAYTELILPNYKGGYQHV